MDKKKIIIASDHGGFKLKEKIKTFLKKSGFEQITDLGTDSSESVDYPDFAKKLAKKVASDENLTGILICGTGIGMSMTANKIKGVRAALCHNKETAVKAKEHNNANVLCLGERVLEEKTALETVQAFLDANFSLDERHIRRIKKIE